MNIEVNGVSITLTQDQLAEIARQTNKFKTYRDITSFETACEHLSLDTSRFYDNLDGLTNSEIALRKLKLIVRAIRSFSGWLPRLNDSKQCKNWNYFIIKNGVFSYFDTYYDDGFMSVPSALYLESYEQAQFLGKTYLDLFKIYMTEE